MKKSLSVLLAASLSLAACQNIEQLVPEVADDVLSARIEQGEVTKTVLGESNNILWSENDQIVAFMKTSYGHKYQIKPSFAGKTYADFSKVSSVSGDDLSAGMEWDHNVAYYPYAEGIECVMSEVNYTLDVVLPAEQTYAENSFGNGYFPMVAVSEDNDITFKNVCGGMKLQLKGTQKVTSITVQGKNNEVLSGAATVTAYTDGMPSITMTGTDAVSQSVTLNCGTEGIQLNENTATEFIIALPPVVFTEGFTIKMTDSENNTYIVKTDEENTVLRSSLLVMPAITLERSTSDNIEDDNTTYEPQEGDYVDEYGINHGQGIEIDGVVWAPVNCGYHATDYTYGKLYQWGRKYGQGYSGDLCDEHLVAIGSHSDAIIPTYKTGGIKGADGNEDIYANIYFGQLWANRDWCDPQNEKLWYDGSENSPIKTKYDPCPEGWRIPTMTEYNLLIKNYSSWTTKDEQSGCWFSGSYEYGENVSKVFFPAAGYQIIGSAYTGQRGAVGYYWASTPNYDKDWDRSVRLDLQNHELEFANREGGYSVRCVRE